MTFKRVFITGGASGLGKAIALYYAKQGYKVAIGDINSEALEETKQALLAHTDHVLAFHCDTTQLESLKSARQDIETQWQGLDILFNNAGVAGSVGGIEAVGLDDWQNIIDINLLGVVRGCMAFATLFKKQGSGAIVNIASMAGILTPPNSGAYNTTKAAVIALSETVRYELFPYDVSVHVVCPAFFKTNLTQSLKSPDKTKAFIDKEMEKSSLSAIDVAALIDKQINDKQFILLTHKKERRLWQLKRLLPALYDRFAIKTFTKTLKRKM